MKNVTKHFKIWLIVTLVVLVAGMTIFGVFGMNKSANVGAAYEVEVKVDGVVKEEAANTIKTTAETYLTENGYALVSYTTQQLKGNSEERFILKLSSIEQSKVTTLTSGLKTAIETAINEGGANSYIATVKVSTSKAYNNETFGFVAIAFAVAAVIIFVYYAFMEKISGALTVLCNMAITAALFIAVVACARVPAAPYFGAGLAFAVALSGVLSGGIVNRCNELTKNVANDKKSLYEIGDVASSSSLTRFLFLAVAILIVCALFIILGSVMVKFAAILALIACVVAMFSAYAWSAFFWATFKKFKKTKKYKALSKAVEETAE